MRNKIYCSLLTIASFLFSANTFAQENVTSESVMRSNGKIYVVVAICVTILIGLFLYIASIDKKIGKIEKENL